jgi:hypothetical protein
VELGDLHQDFAWFVVVGNALAGVWALAAHWLTPLRTPALWWVTGVVQVSVFVEVILGVIMVSSQGIEAPEFHMLYGFSGIVAVGIIYSYRQQIAPYRYLLYGLGGLFIMGLGIRAMTLGPR